MIKSGLVALTLIITLCVGWVNTALAEEAESASAEPAASESTAVGQAPVLRSYRYQVDLNRRLAQRKAATEARRKGMEYGRSLRRWWNNPVAEDRRQWNKARNRWLQDMAEERSSYNSQFRPHHGYERGYSYWRIYP